MTLQPFDVVVVPFPYSDTLGEKRRPAIVVSRSELETEEDRLWLAMVTSAPGALRIGDAVIGDLSAAGLSVSCRVRAGKIATLDRSRVLRRAGSLAAPDRERVREALVACAGW